MADYIDNEAEESEEEVEEYDEEERIKLKRLKDETDDEDQEDDEERLQEELKDLIDDNPIEESDSDAESLKRKKYADEDDDDNLDDRLDEEDLDLLEENLGVKIDRQKKFKRLRRIEDDESDDDYKNEAEVIANELFEGSDVDDDRVKEEKDDEDFRERSESDGDYSETDDFIVDDQGRPINKQKKRRHIFTDVALQEAQDIFGVDFDYNDIEKYEGEYDDEIEDDDYEEDETDRPKFRIHKKRNRKSIFELYEPSELERGHFTDIDNEIRITDLPERMHCRSIPVTPVEEGTNELEEEAEWIYKYAFSIPPITIQNQYFDNQYKRNPQLIQKIRKVLDLLRNQSLEVPFIAFYRKECINPDLTINDLWKIYHFDEKWCQLKFRKKNLLKLFEKMEQFQGEQILKEPQKQLPEGKKLVSQEDMERFRNVETVEELKDMYTYFFLYYGQEIPLLQDFMWKKKLNERKEKYQFNLNQATDNENDREENINKDVDSEIPEHDTLKQAIRRDLYSIFQREGFGRFVQRFGLTPEQFGENLRDNYQRHEVEQEFSEPLEAAAEYVTNQFPHPKDVLRAAQYMVAMQISCDPVVRKCVRESFYERAGIKVTPTKKGLKEIDENHYCYGMKYLNNKPVHDLIGDQFLKLVIAEEEKLIVLTIGEAIKGNMCHNYIDEVKQYYYKDEFSHVVQQWNKIRGEILEMAFNNILFPVLRKELRAQLLSETYNYILFSCAKKLSDWLKIAPFSIEYPDEEEDDWDTSKGLRVMALAYNLEQQLAPYVAVVNTDGECSAFLKIPHILKLKSSWKDGDRISKDKDLSSLGDFIYNNKPHVICISGESREALMIKKDLEDIISLLVDKEQMPQIPVEIVDNNLAKVFANSIRGETEFRDFPPLLRQAISLARRLQDPLTEFSLLCTMDEEILCLQYHPLKDHIPKDQLLNVLHEEFINRTNETGVDINKALANSNVANLVQFIAGLGPRKANALLKTLKQAGSRLENRTQLVTVCHMGPKVFINCAGFIKIDTNSLGDSTEAYVEVLDGSRVHPETYEWARKMAVDALEYDEMQEDTNPAGALEEILESPEKLKDLDLDAFAEELERQGFGNKNITLYDIRAELTHRYKDLRAPYRSPNPEELFNMLTKETPESFYIGKIILACVTGIAHRKPKGEQLDKANPVRNDENGMWQCPFCLKSDFQELSEVWNHFDAGSCPGQAIGVRLRLDNSISGFIPVKFLSDNNVTNPEERVQKGQVIHCRITKIDVEKFAVECTSRTSDLLDKSNEWKPAKDLFYDYETETKDSKIEEDKKKTQMRQTYVKRVIVHPSFHNINFKETEKCLESMEQGDVIFRPSSKGSDHLTVTWKVTNGIYQHIDIREEGKENVFSLDSEEFEDLDEIVARHINPMASHARDLLNFRYYHDTDGGSRDKADHILKEEKGKNPSKIHYFVSASKEFPGKFMLSYLPRHKSKHEFITVTPEGFRFRGHVFETTAHLFKWFKEHFRDPIPRTPNTPKGSLSAHTPYSNTHTPSYPASGILSQNAENSMFNTYTPGNYGGAYSYVNTPYTPSGQTPYMTPYHTPHTSQTPRYGISTPRTHPFPPSSHTPLKDSPIARHIPRTPNHMTSTWPISSDSWSSPKGGRSGTRRNFRGSSRGSLRFRGNSSHASRGGKSSYKGFQNVPWSSNSRELNDTTPLHDENEWKSTKSNSNSLSQIDDEWDALPAPKDNCEWDTVTKSQMQNEHREMSAKNQFKSDEWELPSKDQMENNEWEPISTHNQQENNETNLISCSSKRIQACNLSTNQEYESDSILAKSIHRNVLQGDGTENVSLEKTDSFAAEIQKKNQNSINNSFTEMDEWCDEDLSTNTEIVKQNNWSENSDKNKNEIETWSDTLSSSNNKIDSDKYWQSTARNENQKHFQRESWRNQRGRSGGRRKINRGSWNNTSQLQRWNQQDERGSFLRHQWKSHQSNNKRSNDRERWHPYQNITNENRGWKQTGMQNQRDLEWQLLQRNDSKMQTSNWKASFSKDECNLSSSDSQCNVEEWDPVPSTDITMNNISGDLVT